MGWYHMVPYGTIWYLIHMVPYGTIRYHMVPYGTIWFSIVPFFQFSMFHFSKFFTFPIIFNVPMFHVFKVYNVSFCNMFYTIFWNRKTHMGSHVFLFYLAVIGKICLITNN